MAANAAMRPASEWRSSSRQRTRPIIAPGIMAPSEPPPIEPRSPQPRDMATAPRRHHCQRGRVVVIDEMSGGSAAEHSATIFAPGSCDPPGCERPQNLMRPPIRPRVHELDFGALPGVSRAHANGTSSSRQPQRMRPMLSQLGLTADSDFRSRRDRRALTWNSGCPR